ncbi:hypothetical protein AHAS_Ahas13G0214100 [Arachis hypogaea]
MGDLQACHCCEPGPKELAHYCPRGDHGVQSKKGEGDTSRATIQRRPSLLQLRGSTLTRDWTRSLLIFASPEHSRGRMLDVSHTSWAGTI